MKNAIKVPLVRMIGIIATVAIITFGMAGYPDDGGGKKHEHTFGTAWVTNTTHHWHECTAGDGEKSGYAEHSFDPDDDKCTTCGYDSKIAEIAEELAEADGGDSADDPIELKVEIDLGDGSEANSGWQNLLAAIGAADKFVDLDLSDCTLTGTEFNTGVKWDNDKNAYVGPNGMDKIVSVTLPNGVTGIGNRAFMGCTSLTSVTIPDSVTTIDMMAFAFTGLTSVTIPNSVTSIGDGAFRNTGLMSVSIPDNVTSIDDMAFYYCTSLASVTIGNSVETIGNQAFQNCTSLTSVTIPAGVTSIGYVAFMGCTSLKDLTIGSGVETIGSDAFKGCTSLENLTINAKAIDNWFGDVDVKTGIKSVTIGNSVETIGNQAFQNCTSLTSVTIPASVTTIGNSAFGSCTGLTSVIFQGTITEANFGSYAPFLGDLRDKYLATGGGAGTYTRSGTSPFFTWAKQQ